MKRIEQMSPVRVALAVVYVCCAIAIYYDLFVSRPF